MCACDNKVKPTKYLGQIYTDSLVHDKRAMELLIDVIGEVRANVKGCRLHHGHYLEKKTSITQSENSVYFGKL